MGSIMVIYEVNLDIDEAIYPEFILWLNSHIEEMLQLPGFMQASLLKQNSDEISGKVKVTVQYQLVDQDDLQRYFDEFAPKMREAGIQRFKDQFSTTRRTFEVQAILKSVNSAWSECH